MKVKVDVIVVAAAAADQDDGGRSPGPGSRDQYAGSRTNLGEKVEGKRCGRLDLEID